MPLLSALAAPDHRLYSGWSHGPSSDPAFFPIAVWLQAPANAERYRAAGINTYVGLWKGPTEEQLAALKKAGMQLICEQNQVALRHKDDTTIIGWMHGDEPDNAQSIPGQAGYGPPIKPEKIIAHYQHLRVADPTRPVMLNLGQGVAWENYYGRGVRTGHLEDYPEYLKGCDIVSFDIYPVVHEHKEIAGHLEYVARGVDRLVGWARGSNIVWNCLECTRISNPDRKATPQQVRSEAWMSLIHGSRGLIYFVHQFKPSFREAALLDDAEMLGGVTKLNLEIASLAPALNSPSITNELEIACGNESMPVDVMVKRSGHQLYLFAVGMRAQETTATFTLKRPPQTKTAKVVNEGRQVSLKHGTLAFEDHFGPYEVHLYEFEE